MMSYREPFELPEIPIAGRQIGDTDLMTSDGVIHLPNCNVWKTTADRVDPANCSCGAKFVKPREFVEDREIIVDAGY